jgi:transcriptional regulator with XRE-family HTH domain
MVAGSDQSFIQARELGGRLRQLREDRRLTQKQLAIVLSTKEQVGVTTISSWENSSPERLPPLDRLAVYARLFSTERSFESEGPRLLRDDELTEMELKKEAALYAELRTLREQVQSPNSAPATNNQISSIWHFNDENPISIVCSEAEPQERPPYANPLHLNYTPYASFADLNALMDVYGEVKANNPSNEVEILPPEKLTHNFALNHLVFIGGAAVAKAEADTEGDKDRPDANAKTRDVERFAPNIPLPVAKAIPGTNTYGFICRVKEEWRGYISLRRNGILEEDIGLIARGPHPNVPDRTVTMLSGITSRGVHGAALCFIHRRLREKNEEFFKNTFGNTDTFCILMRVPVHDNTAFPPNLSESRNRLYEWSPETGACW